MSNPARIGDMISDGDFVAQGSKNVIIGDMPVALQGFKTTGHSAFPPTTLNGPCTQTIIINDLPVVLAGVTEIQPHKKPKKPFHSAISSSGELTVQME